jgi:hypothetical protein
MWQDLAEPLFPVEELIRQPDSWSLHDCCTIKQDHSYLYCAPDVKCNFEYFFPFTKICYLHKKEMMGALWKWCVSTEFNEHKKLKRNYTYDI